MVKRCCLDDHAGGMAKGSLKYYQGIVKVKALLMHRKCIERHFREHGPAALATIHEMDKGFISIIRKDFP
jgi:hypothetical protein